MQVPFIAQKTLGNYSDFRSGDTRNKEFIFVLNHINQNPSYKSARGVGVHFPPSFRLALVDSVYDESKGVMREIRYIPGEMSIYKDEQTADDKVAKATYYAEFVNGEYVIQGHDTLKLKFFMLSNYNGTNPKRDAGRNVRFYLVDPGLGLETVMAEDELLTEAQQFCYKGSWDEVAAYAMVLNIPITNDVRQVRYSLKMRAQADPKRFMEGLKNPKMKRKYFVMQALNEGIIEKNFTTNSINWKKGRAITQSPIGKDLIDDFVDATFSPAGETVYKTLMGILRPELSVPNVETELKPELSEAKIAELKADLAPKEKPKMVLSDENDEELVALVREAVSKGVIEYLKPMWYKYKGETYRKEDGMVSALRTDHKLVAHLRVDLSK